MEILDTIKDLQWQFLLIKRKIRQKIQSLPDNPNIKRIPGTSNCFTMKISEILKDIDSTLSPEYYDFKYQYKIISKKIKNVTITGIENIIKKWIKEGYIRDNEHRMKLHPQVIEYLKEIL
jgi:hypothetical protein